MARVPRDLPAVGWREWVALPELGIEAIKAKVDTGARSSSIHASELRFRRYRGRELVSFCVHPLQHDVRTTIQAECEVLERRRVKSSNGVSEERPVVRTTLRLLGRELPVELTLSARDEMGFRMLLGRQAIKHHFTVDPGGSFFGGVPLAVRRRKKKRKVRRRSKGTPS